MNKFPTTSLFFSLLGILLVLPHPFRGSDYYVKPSVDSKCPPSEEPCKTLDEYANNTQDFAHDVRLLFLPGFHELIGNTLRLSHLDTVQLIPAPSTKSTTFETQNLIIVCLSCCNITLDSIFSITLANLIIDGTGEHGVVVHVTNPIWTGHKQLLLVDHFSLFESFMAYYVNITNSKVNFTIQNSFFDRSSLILSCDPSVSNSLIKLIIQYSLFKGSSGAGIQISDNGTQQNIILDVIKSEIQGHQQGGIVIDIPLSSSQITIQNSTIDRNIINSSGVGYSAALSIYSAVPNNTIITIIDSHFLHNQDLRGQPTESVVYISRASMVIVINSVFQNNRGTAIRAANVEHHLHLQGIVDFCNNTAQQGGALALVSTQVYIEPGTPQHGTQITFEGNHADDLGGAIYVESTSSLYEANDPDTLTECFYYFPEFKQHDKYSISFTNNTAANGGHHIYGALLKSYCVVNVLIEDSGQHFQIRSHDSYIQDIFYISGAEDSSISSAPSRVCVIDSKTLNGSFKDSCANFEQIFMTRTVIPGEEFHLEAILVGAEFGTVTGVIHAQFLRTNKTEAKLQPHLDSQRVDELDTPHMLNYSMFSSSKDVVLVLTATAGRVITCGDKDQIGKDIQIYNGPGFTGIVQTSLLTTPICINITLLGCPLGFYLNPATMGCDCNPRICCDQPQIQESLLNGTGGFYIGSNIWVNGCDSSSNIILHHECPFYYCKINSSLRVHLSHPDTQCAMGHAGRLCGKCADGLSLVIGSNLCKPCNNDNLALLIFFAAAGFMLVFFIKALNMTVSQGTINGLIFYANIIWAYQSILFSVNTPLFLKIFIAWINLDFGIEVCFTDGLTAYVKTWLQFAFPLYIWSIAVGIILAAHCSKRMTKLFGNNSVQVLATLFLLSYNKFLRTVIVVLVPATLHVYTENGTAIASENQVVWAFDGNLKFGRMPHIILLIVALLVLVILWLPYTFVLLFIQPLRSHSNHRCLTQTH